VSESIWERDDYEQDQDGIINPEDELSENPMDTVLEQGYSPPERPLGLDKFGTTLAEERQGETLDQRLAEEEPDPGDGDPDAEADGDGLGDVTGTDGELRDDEVGGPRAGRLAETDAGAEGAPDREPDLEAFDEGRAGGAASAEEAAVHVVPSTEE
jgi:hypothetical protein